MMDLFQNAKSGGFHIPSKIDKNQPKLTKPKSVRNAYFFDSTLISSNLWHTPREHITSLFR